MRFISTVSPVNSGERELEHEERERLVSERPLRASSLVGASRPVTVLPSPLGILCQFTERENLRGRGTVYPALPGWS